MTQSKPSLHINWRLRMLSTIFLFARSINLFSGEQTDWQWTADRTSTSQTFMNLFQIYTSICLNMLWSWSPSIPSYWIGQHFNSFSHCWGCGETHSVAYCKPPIFLEVLFGCIDRNRINFEPEMVQDMLFSFSKGWISFSPKILFGRVWIQSKSSTHVWYKKRSWLIPHL